MSRNDLTFGALLLSVFAALAAGIAEEVIKDPRSAAPQGTAHVHVAAAPVAASSPAIEHTVVAGL